MSKGKRRKVKERIGYRAEQRKNHNQNVDKRLEYIKKLEFDIDEQLIKDNDRTVGFFYRRRRE